MAQANSEAERFKAIYESLKDQTKDAKAEWELSRNKLQKLIAERDHGVGKPPFDDGLFSYHTGPDGELKHNDRPPVVNGAAKSKTTPSEEIGKGRWYPEDLFKAFPLDRWDKYGLTPGDIAALKDGIQKDRPNPYPILTIGDLAGFVDPSVMGFSRNLTDIKGVGPKVVERIENAQTKFFADWPKIQDEFAAEKGYKQPGNETPDAKPEPKKPAKGKSNAGKRGGKGGTGTSGASGNGDGKGEADAGTDASAEAKEEAAQAS